MPPKPEYLELKVFLSFFVDRFLRKPHLPPELHPVAVLEAQEKASPSRALEGLRMAVNDCIEMSSHLPTAQVAALDAELSASGILTLSQVRRRFWSRYAAVLKRGSIKNEADYYLVQNVLADQSILLEAAERQQLEAIANAFEQRLL